MSEYFEFHLTSRSRSIQSDCYLNKKKFDKNDLNDIRRTLNEFKEKIGSSMNLVLKDKSCYNDDDFLMQFLFARKFQCDDAFDLLINYYLYKEKNKLLLQKLTIFDETIQLALREGFPSILKERDRRGRKVLVYIASNWDPTQIGLDVIYRALLISLEKLLEDKETQSQGFVVIVDWTNFSLKQSKYLSPKMLRIMIDGLQDCLPVKFKAIHFIGQPWYVEMALSVIKPFLKEKIRQNIYLHGSNLSTLHQLVPKDILPSELGGEGRIINPLDWYHILLESSQNMQTFKPYMITETTIYSKVPIIKNSTTTKTSSSSSTTATIKNDNNNYNHYSEKNGKIFNHELLLSPDETDKMNTVCSKS